MMVMMMTRVVPDAAAPVSKQGVESGEYTQTCGNDLPMLAQLLALSLSLAYFKLQLSVFVLFDFLRHHLG